MKIRFQADADLNQRRSPDRVKRNPGLVLSLLDSAALRPAYELRFQALQWR